MTDLRLGNQKVSQKPNFSYPKRKDARKSTFIPSEKVSLCDDLHRTREVMVKNHALE